MRIANQFIQFFSIYFIALYISGCAISNEGATDYRYIDHSKSTNSVTKPTRSVTKSKSSVTKPTNIFSKYIKPKDVQKAINPGDALVISLKQIFIHNFVEFRSPLRWVRGEPANGEIAIIVNAFEGGKGETTDFSHNGKENARVVFFSDDVWEGQFLNLSNLSTIYGPLKYDGGPFILDLYVVEMDRPSQQLKQLLTNLTNIGSTFYPPSAPIVSPLAQLAGTLIDDDQDDRSYHYTSEFRVLGGDSYLNTAILQTGHYVFIREENRKSTTKWNELSFDEQTGRIIYNTAKEGKDHCLKKTKANEYPDNCYYKENSYLVVEINTAASSINNDVKQMIYKDLSSNIFSNSASIFKSAIPEQSLENLSSELKKLSSYDNISKQLTILQSTSNSYVENTVALDSFVNFWTKKDLNNKIIFQLNDKDRGRIEARITRIISTCQSDQNKVIEMINKLRARNLFTAKNNSDVINALSCLYSKL